MSDAMTTIDKGDIRLEIFWDTDAESPREWDNLATMICSHRQYSLGDAQAENTGDYDNWRDWLEEEVMKLHGGPENVVALPLYLYDHSGITISTGPFGDRWDSGQVGWIFCCKDVFRNETGYTEDELFSEDRHRTPVVGEHVTVRHMSPLGDGKLQLRDGYIRGKNWGKVTGISTDTDGVTRFLVDFDWMKGQSYRKAENVHSVAEGDIMEVMSEYAQEMLVGEVKTYDDYLTGNVFGYQLTKRVGCEHCGNVEYEEIDSCWGFYGDDAIEGMLENAPSEYTELFAEARREM